MKEQRGAILFEDFTPKKKEEPPFHWYGSTATTSDDYNSTWKTVWFDSGSATTSVYATYTCA